MSRRSLYRHSGRYSSVPYVASESDDRVVRWERESVSPSLPTVDGLTVPAMSQSGTPAPGAPNDPYGVKNNAAFYVKIWVSTGEKSEPSTALDCDEDDYLIFERPVRTVIEEPKQEGGLSAADIRGAVGGEAIPGMSAASNYSKENGSATLNQTTEQQSNTENNKPEEISEVSEITEPNPVVENSETPIQTIMTEEVSVPSTNAPSAEPAAVEDTEMIEADDL